MHSRVDHRQNWRTFRLNDCIWSYAVSNGQSTMKFVIDLFWFPFPLHSFCAVLRNNEIAKPCEAIKVSTFDFSFCVFNQFNSLLLTADVTWLAFAFFLFKSRKQTYNLHVRSNLGILVDCHFYTMLDFISFVSLVNRVFSKRTFKMRIRQRVNCNLRRVTFSRL